MATEFTLRRADGKPFGSFAQVQALIRRLFPSVEFFWTTSGPQKIRLAGERGVVLPPHIREWMATLPSLLEGVAEGSAFHVTFGMGYEEPVACLYVTLRGVGAGTGAGAGRPGSGGRGGVPGVGHGVRRPRTGALGP
jgi:hypothetical protein